MTHWMSSVERARELSKVKRNAPLKNKTDMDEWRIRRKISKRRAKRSRGQINQAEMKAKKIFGGQTLTTKSMLSALDLYSAEKLNFKGAGKVSFVGTTILDPKTGRVTHTP